MNRSAAAFRLSVQRLVREHGLDSDSLFLWTFTFAEALSPHEAKTRWNHLLTLLRQRWPKLKGLRIFETHRQHGLHVHMLAVDWLYVKDVRDLAKTAGFGRIHVKRVPSAAAAKYCAKGLYRKANGFAKGWRLWAAFGEWVSTKVKDVVFDTPFRRVYLACKEWLGWEGNYGFFQKMRIVRCLLQRTIVEGWTDGLGPGDRPYGSFNWTELVGYSRHPGVGC